MTYYFTERNIGQFLMTGISGYSLSNDEQKFITDNNIGGVILFSNNYKNLAQLKELISSLQELASGHFLFISVDQEGGRVQRFKDSFTKIPSMKEVCSGGSLKGCEKIHQIIAKELKNVGVNLSFAPVCDVLTNQENKVIGDRAFSSNPFEVSDYVEASIKGLKSRGIISVAKHFPGHGDTLEDSHEKLPVVHKSIKQMRDCELIPFYRAIQSGVDMVLMGHLHIHCLDLKNPTTLSPAAYQFLREELKYDGVIISDDMEMRAISDRFNGKDAAQRAFLSGCDILVYRSMEKSKVALEGFHDLFKEKKITPSGALKRLSNILELKAQKSD